MPVLDTRRAVNAVVVFNPSVSEMRRMVRTRGIEVLDGKLTGSSPTEDLEAVNGSVMQRGELAERHEPETHLIPLSLQAAFGRREGLRIYGTDYDTPDGTCIRDYVHVSDLATAHVLALERLLAGGDSLTANLGTGRGYSVREVIETVAKVTGRPVPASAAPRREGDPARLVADGRLAKSALGWEPRYPELTRQVDDAVNSLFAQ